MKHIAFILLLAVFACNQKQSNEKKDNLITKDRVIGKYPSVIDSLGVQGLFDNAKWALYCIYCTDTCEFKKNYSISPSKTFGTLDLRFSEVRKQNDTIEIDFYFYAGDTLRYDMITAKNPKKLAIGCGFRSGNDSILYYISETTMRYFWEKGPTSRFSNPLQPGAIAYIRNNKDNLDPWFREQAKLKGLLQ